MRTLTVAIPSLMLAIAVSLCAGPLAAQTSPTPSPTCTPNSFTIPEASRSHEVANEVYAPSVTPAIYLVNFIILYMANPDLAAYMPAYKAPIPQPLVDCLEQNPMGCPWADYRQYFDEQVIDHRNCFWPDMCQEDPRWAHLAPRKVTRPEQINEPLGEEAGRSARSHPRDRREHDLHRRTVPLCNRDTSERSRPRNHLPLHL